MKTRIIVAITQHSFRELLVQALRVDGGYEVVAELTSGVAVLEKCATTMPELLIVDLKFPDMAVADLLRTVRSDFPVVRVMVYSGSGNLSLTREVLTARPHGFVHREEPLSEFHEALRAVLRGSRFISGMGSRVLDAPSDPALSRNNGNGLTKREGEVLVLLAQGCSSKQIGASLGLSPKTVDHYRADLMEKLGIHDVAGLTRYALTKGLVKDAS